MINRAKRLPIVDKFKTWKVSYKIAKDRMKWTFIFLKKSTTEDKTVFITGVYTQVYT